MDGHTILQTGNFFCDNMTVFTSSSQPEVTLSKKHNGIAYHICREAVAIGMIRVAHEPTDTNWLMNVQKY